ncbi:MAG: RimK family alpha-L-glutamate ligase [Corallococcus sp.]|nr:RimK family alpha-L-glutamate ligase [Corallococcus sp.]
MKGVIITNPFDRSETQLYKVKRMLREFSYLGVDVETASNDRFAAYVEDGKSVCRLKADFALYFDKDKYTARLLEKSGVRVFNSASATEICDDKMLTHIVLSDGGIAMPTTLSGALCYDKNGVVSDEYLNGAVEKLGLPLVVKECHGSYGEQVYLAETHARLREIVESIKNKSYLFQQYVSQSCGEDMRVIVIGGKAVCGMLRKSTTDFRSNVHRGGTAVAADISEDIAKLCEKAAKIIGLDYCGIDVLLKPFPQICEVNSNAMFQAMEDATSVNVARRYAQHIVDCVKRN